MPKQIELELEVDESYLSKAADEDFDKADNLELFQSLIASSGVIK